MNEFLKETELLDYSNTAIQNLIKERKWQNLSDVDKIKSTYNFVRDEIKLGYNEGDKLPASKVLVDNYGQCNTKATLLMALLRALNVENRIHGFTVDKSLQKGVITGLAYRLSPKNILHTWVEVKVDDKWYSLEGVVIDKDYLKGLQNKFPNCKDSFCGFGVHTENLSEPPIDWNLNNTFIQDKSITKDLGVFNTPDELHSKYKQNLNPFKECFYKNITRHKINRTVKKIREN